MTKKAPKLRKSFLIKLSIGVVLGWFITVSLMLRMPDLHEAFLRTNSNSQINAQTILTLLLPIAPFLFYLVYSTDFFRLVRYETKKPSPTWVRLLTTAIAYPLAMYFVFICYIWQLLTF